MFKPSQNKFRAKRTDIENAPWEYFSTFQEIANLRDMAQYYGNWTQFTGLLDSKGNEIYEGDILGYISENIGAYVVQFENGIFGLHSKFGYWGTIERYFEVVSKFDISADVRGNIFENPNLIEPNEPKVHNFF
jgi:hypothetical protein